MSGSRLHPVGSLLWCCSASIAPQRSSVGHHLNSSSQLDQARASLPSAISKKRTTGGCPSISRSQYAVRLQPWHGIRTRYYWLLALPMRMPGSFRVLSRVLMRDRRVACGERGCPSIRYAENTSTIRPVGYTDAPSHLVGMHLRLRHMTAVSPLYTRTGPNSHRRQSSVSAHSFCRS